MRWVLLPFACLSLAAQSFTPAKQAAIGAAMAENIRQSTLPVRSQEVQDYVAKLGARLAAQLPPSSTSYTFSVVSTDRSNALHEPLSLTGGYIFVPSELLLAVNGEAELAGMLAQAMVRQSAVSQGPHIMMLAENFSGDDPLPGIPLAQRRQLELEADKSAVTILSRAGFDPAALLHYIERVQPPDRVRSVFPKRDARIAALREAVAAETAGFRRIQDQVRPEPSPPKTPPSLQ